MIEIFCFFTTVTPKLFPSFSIIIFITSHKSIISSVCVYEYIFGISIAY